MEQKLVVSVLINKFELSSGGRSFISVRMKPYKSVTLENIDFKVDTGADLTTIAKKELVRLGYSYQWIEKHIIESKNYTLSRAGGKAEPACYIQIPIANVLDRDLVNWPFYVRKENHLDFPNLLGINILTHFNFLFDYENWNFNIKSAQMPKKKLPMLSDQYIENLTASNLFSENKLK